jgi:hypothetical protein
MDDTIIRPPDQIAAGGAAQPPEQGGIIDALRSRGPAPQAALANIMQPSPGPNMGSAFGSGVLNSLGGGLPGQNPYLAQQQQGQKDAFYQQLNMQRMQDARADRELRRQQADTTMLEGLLDKLPEDSQMRGPLAKQLAGIYTRAIPGVPAGPLAADLAEGKVPKEKAAQVLDMLDAGVPPETIASTVGVKPQAVQRMAGIANSDSARKALGFTTRTENKQKVLELDRKEFEGWAEQHGVDTKSDLFSEMMTLSQGRQIRKMTDPELGLLRTQAEKSLSDKAFKEKMRVVEETQSIMHRNRLAEIQEREITKQKDVKNNPLLKPQVVKWQAEYNGIPMLEQRANRVKAAIDLLNKEGLLPAGGTLGEFALAAARAQLKVNRPDINAAFNTLQRFGTPLLMSAEKDLAGQSIGSVMRLKSVAEAEVGGVKRIPKQWWDDFFSDYESGIANKRTLLKKQMEATGVSLDEPIQKTVITKAQYDGLVKKGATDAQIRERYDVLP